MNVELSLQELLEVQEHFNLPSPALVEKDHYVTKALTAITSTNIEPFRLALGGGTALCRAHRYEEFQRNMVYGEPIGFATCLLTLEELASHFS